MRNSGGQGLPRDQDATDLLVKERRPSKLLRGNPPRSLRGKRDGPAGAKTVKSIRRRISVVKNIIINLFANSNELWKLVRTERKKTSLSPFAILTVLREAVEVSRRT